MKYIQLKFLSLALLMPFTINVANAYTYSFTNGTNKDIKIDFHGEAVVGSSMMQGKIPKTDWLKIYNDLKYKKNGKNKTLVTNAGAIKAPSNIPAGNTVSFQFDNLDAGICILPQSVKINGKQQHNMDFRSRIFDSLVAKIRNDHPKGLSREDVEKFLADGKTPEKMVFGGSVCGNLHFVMLDSIDKNGNPYIALFQRSRFHK